MVMHGTEAITRTALENQLENIKNDLLQMGILVDLAIGRSIQALQILDYDLADSVIIEDHALNEIRFRVEEHCLQLIATQQPAARDLRAIVAAMTIVSDLERMGDHAAGIAKTVLRMTDDIKAEPAAGLARMAEQVQMMLQDGMRAYKNLDPHQAYRVASMDDVIDMQYQALFSEYLKLIAQNPDHTARALYLLFSGHNLERIGDRVTNITERVIFMTSGEMEELNQ